MSFRKMVWSKSGLTLCLSYLWTKLIVCIFVGENILWGKLLSSSKLRQNVPCALVGDLYVCLSTQLLSFGHITQMLQA